MPVLDLSAYKPVPATLGDANQIANGMQAIQNCINALDNNNFAAGKIFDPLKLMQDGAVAGQGLVWSAAANGGTGGWVPANVSPGVYRKTTAKVVNGTSAETDLLNGEITIAGNVIGASGVLRLTAWGDWKQNSGGGNDSPRLKLKLGATTLFDTGAPGAVISNAATRYGWRVVVEIHNLGATNSQWATFDFRTSGVLATASGAAFTTGEGIYIVPAGSASNIISALAGNAGAVDTTAANVLALTTINPTVNVGWEIALKSALVEII